VKPEQASKVKSWTPTRLNLGDAAGPGGNGAEAAADAADNQQGWQTRRMPPVRLSIPDNFCSRHRVC